MIPKFRAWFKGDNECEPKMCNEILSIDFEHNEINLRFYDGAGFDAEPNDYLFDLDEVILMQSTGIKDANGKEIYEGDILLDDYNEEYCKVVYQDCAFYLVYDVEIILLGDTSTKYLTIVGNIYENKELLEDK